MSANSFLMISWHRISCFLCPFFPYYFHPLISKCNPYSFMTVFILWRVALRYDVLEKEIIALEKIISVMNKKLFEKERIRV